MRERVPDLRAFALLSRVGGRGEAAGRIDACQVPIGGRDGRSPAFDALAGGLEADLG